jgi:hypothetical protein
MGFLDKLLGRGKEVAEKGMDVAEKTVDRAGEMADKAMDTAEDKLGMHEHDHGDAPETTPPAPGQSA